MNVQAFLDACELGDPDEEYARVTISLPVRILAAAREITGKTNNAAAIAYFLNDNVEQLHTAPFAPADTLQGTIPFVWYGAILEAFNYGQTLGFSNVDCDTQIADWLTKKGYPVTPNAIVKLRERHG